MKESYSKKTRASWDVYYMEVAEIVKKRATCKKRAVGAVIARENRLLCTGYNGANAGQPHCTEQGFCYEGLDECGNGSEYPSRAVHAEINAISQAAKYGIPLKGSTLYTTLEPCFSCLKTIIATGIVKVVYRVSITESEPVQKVKDNLIKQTQVEYKQI